MIFDTPQRLLKKNHRKSLPNHMLFLDTESKKARSDQGEILNFDLGWTCYVRRRPDRKQSQEKWSYWRSSGAVCYYLEALTNEKWTLYVFTHNAFHDLQTIGFFPHFTESGWILDFVYDEGLTYILVIRKGKRIIKILSTTNYFNANVKEIGDVVGLPKLDVDFETSNRRDLSRYCRRDTEIIKAAMESYFAMISENDLGKFAMTKGSQAFAAFRHRFMHTKINLHSHAESVALERACYMGGRTEAFQIGKMKRGPFVSLDVNSLYPYIMANRPVPIRLIDYRTNEPIKEAKRYLKKYGCCAEVVLETKEPAYGVRLNAKLCFPTGRFVANLCTEGMEYAIEHRHLKEIKQISWYEMAIVFHDYVEYFYSLRKRYKEQGNKPFDLMAKYLLNTLYGKFGQKLTITEEEEVKDTKGYVRTDVRSLVTGEKWVHYVLMNKRVTEIGKGEGRNSFVAIANHITESARFYLWHLIKTIGPDRVLYCDTDSLKVRKADIGPVEDLLDSSEIGMLKVEETAKTLEILGAKNYKTENGGKLKGVPKKAERLERNVYRYTQFLGQKEHMRKEVTQGVLIRQIVKTISCNYDKGKVDPSGRVIPFVLSLPEKPAVLLQ